MSRQEIVQMVGKGILATITGVVFLGFVYTLFFVGG